jgi:squalene-hopene/tetraprenyl-beta-curcumene cyclase
MVKLRRRRAPNPQAGFALYYLPLSMGAVLALLAVLSRASAAEPIQETKSSPKLPGNSANEPLAGALSLAKSAEFLDSVTLTWIKQRKCASCHTGFPYLLARPALGDSEAPAVLEVRKFLEDRVANWDQGGKGRGYLKATGPLVVSEGVTEVVAIAATLAQHDAQSTGKLHPRTRQALDRMWELQREDGSWNWNKTRLAPLEHDEYFGAVYAALGVGHAPEGYAQTESAKAGLARLKSYLQKNPAPDLHHKTWLLWASVKLDGVMTPAERELTIKQLLARQRKDGGWSLPSLGDWKRLNGKANDKQAPSDGYATGLVMYVLRQAGVQATQEPIRRGLAWLRHNQRVSGRWFTRSLNQDRTHYITHAGTAFAVMALKACDAVDK